jgi:hypothetical protein
MRIVVMASTTNFMFFAVCFPDTNTQLTLKRAIQLPDEKLRVFAVSLLQQLVASFISNFLKKIVAAHANRTNKVFLASKCRPVRRMMCPNYQMACLAGISAVN